MNIHTFFMEEGKFSERVTVENWLIWLDSAGVGLGRGKYSTASYLIYIFDPKKVVVFKVRFPPLSLSPPPRPGGPKQADIQILRSRGKSAKFP